MKPTTINYFISENYIPDWTLEDAYREILQNFVDYGEYNVNIQFQKKHDIIIVSNTFEPTSTDLLIIGESTKKDNQIGKYGEGLKMAALVLLRNGYYLDIHTVNFTAKFVLITNPTTTIKTLGVEIEESKYGVQINNFDVAISAPTGKFKEYHDTLIKPEDILHTRESYGSIVNRKPGELYVGGLYVCNLPKLNHSYNLLPKNIQLDRDRKVPRDFEVKWNISKIQETYEAFDQVGKSEDVLYSDIPSHLIPIYKPMISNGKIVFTTPIKDEEGKIEEVVVADRFNDQLIISNFYDKIVTKLKGFLVNSLSIPQLAYKFREQYCEGKDAREAFNVLMLRLGVNVDKGKV